MEDEEHWRNSYRRAVASVFAMGEVIGQLRDDNGLSVEYTDSLINAATTKWHDLLDAKIAAENLT